MATNRYVVVLFVPKYPHQHREVVVGRCATRAVALRRANRVLSRRARSVTRALPARDYEIWYAEVFDGRRGVTLDVIDAPEDVVPSVGELGWAPL